MFAGAFYLGTQHALYACQHPTQARIVRGIIHHTLFAGKSDIALQHTAVEPGGFILEDTFLLVEAKKDLSTEALVHISLIAVSWSCLLHSILQYLLTFHSG